MRSLKCVDRYGRWQLLLALSEEVPAKLDDNGFARKGQTGQCSIRLVNADLPGWLANEGIIKDEDGMFFVVNVDEAMLTASTG